ncbi:hypothetical protein lwe1251 [Listeria welshimeri serovar 6b str. SLCC5334]|uniref:Uncharacterized protein n=1 Tax=Listeria welshimeri serovar 6b (strain ATCC 35897 / DSM 20650 / CCUG 15529 / CIP 8149 / NCTC 11857 / SLCC 5334 / V8) TaxID=386043 RepID=A0AI37_LISW6|nr:hypothetical protein lwe1251 [Listeria welshimeri serovar 6b str. SLCC5334]
MYFRKMKGIIGFIKNKYLKIVATFDMNDMEKV